MNEVGWKRWREAEAAIGRGAALETAAAKLPPRQAAILRALDALERGDRASIEAAAKATEDLDIGAVLDLVQAAPRDIDPTAVRAGLKRAGLTNTPLPELDLLRQYAAALASDFATVPPALTKAARIDPVLAAAMMGLNSGFAWHDLGSELAERSMRIAKLWAAAAGLARGQSGPLQGIVARVDPALARKDSHLDPARWPAAKPLDRMAGLRRLAGGGRYGSDSNELERWLDAPLEQRWELGCQQELMVALHGPRDERRRLLGRLLVAIERVLREGRPHEAIPAVDAALELVDGLSGLPAQDVLMLQLLQLLHRLVWWTSDLPPDGLAAAVWHIPAPFTTEERRHIAATLLPAIEPSADDTDAVAEMLVVFYQDPHQLGVEGLKLLERHAGAISQGRLSQGLRDVAPWHRELVLAAHAATRGLEVEAFERAVDTWLVPGAELTKQLDRMRVAVAAHVVRSALKGVLVGAPRNRKERERLAAAATRWFEALEADTIQVDPDVLVQAVALADALRSLARPALQPARVAALVRRWMATHALPDGANTLSHARLALAIDDRATAETTFRALGRSLREAPRERAIELALRWCAGLHDDGEAQRHPVITGWQKALDAWLLQQPKALLGSTALALARAEVALAEPLFDWGCEKIADKDWTAPWEALEQLHVQNSDLGPDLDEMFTDDAEFQAAFEMLRDMALGGLPPGLPAGMAPGRSGRAPRRKGRGRGGDRG